MRLGDQKGSKRGEVSTMLTAPGGKGGEECEYR